jgi:hypothetical protein
MNTFNRSRSRSPEYLRAFFNEYLQTMRTHTAMMSEYNRNITNIISMLGESDTPRVSRPYGNRSDIATLIYLLSQTGRRSGLSQIQIENATENVVYTSETFPGITQCPISLDDFEENEVICQISHCRHIFKTHNIMRWFDRHTCCPVCRYNLQEPVTENNVASRFNNNNNMDISGNIFEFTVPF